MDEDYILRNINKKDILYLYEGLVNLFPEAVFGAKGKNMPHSSSWGPLSKEDFENLVLNLTGKDSLLEAVKEIVLWKRLLEQGETLYSPVPVNLDELVEIYEEKISRFSDKQKIVSNKVIENIKKLNEIRKKYSPEAEKIAQVKPQFEDVFVEPEAETTTITLTKEQQKLAQMAHKDPKRFADELSKRIVKISPPFISKEKMGPTAETIAYDFTRKLLSINPHNPKVVVTDTYSLLTVFADPDNPNFAKLVPDLKDRVLISKNVQEIALALEKDSVFTANLIQGAAGPGWSPFYLPSKATYKLTTEQSAHSLVQIKSRDFFQQLAEYQQSKQQISFYLAQKYPEFDKYLKPGEKEEFIKDLTQRYHSIVSSLRLRFTAFGRLPEISKVGNLKIGYLSEFWTSKNIQLSSAGISLPATINGSPTSHILLSQVFNFSFKKAVAKLPLASKASQILSGLGTKAASKVLAKLGLQAIASSAPVIGNIIAFIATELLSRFKNFLAKHKDEILIFLVGGGLLVGGIILGFPLLSLAGILSLAGGLTASASGISLGAGVASFARSLLYSLTDMVIPSILTPVLITLIGIPFVVALIIFIINSSAYVYPPATSNRPSLEQPIVSPYIKVTKAPSPTGPFENSELPLTIEYAVEIIALKGTLTNIKISYSCDVIKEGVSPSCPSTDPAINSLINNIDPISPTKPFSFKYKQTYTSPDFEDTLAIDTITVTADTAEKKGVTAAGSATIKIGDPPEECPSGWPTNSGYITQGAYSPPQCSHRSLEAIDIGTAQTPVYATHTGVVITSEFLNCYGKTVDIKSTCNGREFFSRYSHLETISVSAGQVVKFGQQIGISGNTGTCGDGLHLHYDFRYYPSLSATSYPNNPPYMMTPYIPEDIPRGCCSVSECGNISIP